MSVTPTHRQHWSGLAAGGSAAQVGILGVPFDDAASFRKGAAEAPGRIRAFTQHVAPITEEGVILKELTICDYGDVERDLDWERYFATVAEHAASALAHPFSVFLGGDHSVTIPLLKAFDQHIGAPYGILHIDAHTDLADRYEGHHWSHACTERRALEYPHMQPEHLVFCGIRSWLAEELDFLAAHPITVHTAAQMHRYGIQATARDVIARLRHLDNIYLTLDIDCLDPAYAPGTGTPEAGGLTTRELLDLLRLIFAALPVRAMDIVEVSPPLDYSDITTVAAIKVLYEVFGWVQARNRS
jgi:agmatinase